MARTSFLSETELKEAERYLRAPWSPPTGDVRFINYFPNFAFSRWLQFKLEDFLSQKKLWLKAHPIFLGSWARGELTPKSDIDLLFCGEEPVVAELVDELHREGFKIRYRLPEDPTDWTVGVEHFDILALMSALPMTSEAAVKLIEQQKKIDTRSKSLRKKLLMTMVKERNDRADRYDSISNFLEPNIKYGHGGLRDLQQGLMIHSLFKEHLGNCYHALEVFRYYKAFFLTLRQKMHLENGSDVMTAGEQLKISEWFGYESLQEFNKHVQRGLSRVSFYADWMVEQAKTIQGKEKQRSLPAVQTPKKCILLLKEDPSILMQYHVRKEIDRIWPLSQNKKLNWKWMGSILDRALNCAQSDELIVALFRSRVLDRFLRDLNRLMGYVQHDQYHRYTADTHILQCIREAKRVCQHSRSFGSFAKIIDELSTFDWRVVAWTCLYHDLGKGLGGDHSDKGVALVRRDFKKFQLPDKLRKEVEWMVKNHLLLSQAAFRMNSQSPTTWEGLIREGMTLERLYRLAVFTLVDIRGTNPEAWNDWKQRLMIQLVETMSLPSTHGSLRLIRMAKKANIELLPGFIERIDPILIEHIPTKVLVEDLKRIEKSDGDVQPFVCSSRSGTLWVRFYSQKDRVGLFANYVSQLYKLGGGILHASVHTIENFGVYDWFLVRTSRTSQSFAKALKMAEGSREQLSFPKVRFDQINIVSQDPAEYVVSFRGRDQKGLLMEAARALSDEGITILWASAQTWGRQIDDVFGLKPEKDIESKLRTIRKKLQ